jgi:hypothetical protein
MYMYMFMFTLMSKPMPMSTHKLKPTTMSISISHAHDLVDVHINFQDYVNILYTVQCSFGISSEFRVISRSSVKYKLMAKKSGFFEITKIYFLDTLGSR